MYRLGYQVSKKAFIGIDLMVPAGIRLDLADGTFCLPDKVRTQLEGRRPQYGEKIQQIAADEKYLAILVGNSVDANVGRGPL